MKKKPSKKWFAPSNKPLNWSKDDSQSVRRKNALMARRGNYLKVARALQALANVTQDAETARKAKTDAVYFYKMHQRKKE